MGMMGNQIEVTVPVLIISESSSDGTFSSRSSSTRRNNERIFSSSDEILDVLFQENSTSPSNNYNNTNDHRYNDYWDRQKLINEQLLIVGKSAVLHNTKTNRQALHDVLHRMEEQLQSFVFMHGDVWNETKIPSIVDCHTFPFVWRLQSKFQILNGPTYPKLLAWYQHIETNCAVQRTMPAHWWWWW
jgi:hypothetical protein